MGYMSMGSGFVGGTLMIALALGFIVVSMARKETSPLKMLGYIIGISIMCMSGALLAQKLTLRMIECHKAYCPMNKAMQCGKMMKR